MKIAVLGANGLVGVNLVNFLSISGHDVLAVDKYSNDPLFQITDSVEVITSDFSNLITTQSKILRSADVVVFLISGVSPGKPIPEHQSKLRNEQFGLFLAQLAQYNLKKFVFSSTGGAMFSKVGPQFFSETDHPSPISQYALEKLSFEKTLFQSDLIRHTQCLVTRGANFYGWPLIPRDNHGLIQKLFFSAIYNKDFNLIGTGKEIRDFIEVRDVVSMLYILITSETQHNVYNIGSGYGTSVNDVIKLVKEITNTDFPVIFKPLPSSYVSKSVLSMSRYEAEFGPVKTMSLKDGLMSLWNGLNY